ncbi:universal stress protein [Nocardia sp. AG03]|uniref:universal stress protein n=1 Tax=Nocardia sp. AG03 TaxID=3025312 RepID=UPI00241839FF|nr:universal stress protein [Nocardia sp. AG03]
MPTDPIRVDGPRTTPPPTTQLLVGVDRHPAGQAALAYAVGLARRLDAHLHVVHAVDIDDLPVDPDSPDFEDRVHATVIAERDRACALLSTLPGNWTYQSAPGDPTQLLLAIADTAEVEMIVLGAPRHGMMSLLERLMGESVAARVIHHAHRPVTLVPAS